MRKFLLKTTVILSLTIIPYFIISYNDVITSDSYYYKYTHRANHLIMGLSPINRGIAPQILKEQLNLSGNILNYGFNGNTSPFGKKYYNMIRSKVKPTKQKNGVFIISVSPLALSIKPKEEKENIFRENHTPLKKLIFNNINPNLEFLTELSNSRQLVSTFLEKRLAFLLGKKESKGNEAFCDTKNYPDGWTPFFVRDSSQIKKMTQQRIKKFQNQHLLISSYRQKYLENTIQYLQQYGKVYLIRMPSNPIIHDILNIKNPEFEIVIQELTKKYQLQYYDLNKHIETSQLPFVDGVHLNYTGAITTSNKLAELLLQTRN